MKYNYPAKYRGLLSSLQVDFDPFGEIDDGRLLALIEALEEHISLYGVNAAGDGENETGALCADLLTWLARTESDE